MPRLETTDAARRSPAQRAVDAIAQFPVLRHGPALAAARAHARQLQSWRAVDFEAHRLLEPLDDLTPLADSPADLSRALLDCLLGRWPAPAPASPGLAGAVAGLEVQELGWDEWLRCGGAPWPQDAPPAKEPERD